jgi:ABC-type phosphate transport system permease subunit
MDDEADFHFDDTIDMIRDAWRHDLIPQQHDLPHNQPRESRTLTTHLGRILTYIFTYIIVIIVLAFLYIQVMETISFVRNKSVIFSTKYA